MVIAVCRYLKLHVRGVRNIALGHTLFTQQGRVARRSELSCPGGGGGLLGGKSWLVLCPAGLCPAWGVVCLAACFSAMERGRRAAVSSPAADFLGSRRASFAALRVAPASWADVPPDHPFVGRTALRRRMDRPLRSLAVCVCVPVAPGSLLLASWCAFMALGSWRSGRLKLPAPQGGTGRFQCFSVGRLGVRGVGVCLFLTAPCAAPCCSSLRSRVGAGAPPSCRPFCRVCRALCARMRFCVYIACAACACVGVSSSPPAPPPCVVRAAWSFPPPALACAWCVGASVGDSLSAGCSWLVLLSFACGFVFVVYLTLLGRSTHWRNGLPAVALQHAPLQVYVHTVSLWLIGPLPRAHLHRALKYASCAT